MQRLPPTARVRSGADFNRCFAARQRLPGRYFLLQWRHNESDGARIGLAVSRRVDRRAVGRNRIKRLLREAFRRTRAQLPAVDLVFVPKPEAGRAPSEVLRQDVEQLLERARALPPPAPQGTMPAAS
nr:ribonuclease P protein component [Lysobacter sp. CAU 1642]